MKKLLSFVLIIAVAIFLSGISVSAAEYELDFGHVQPEDHSYHLMAEEFKEEVEELSDGRIEVNIHPGGALGDERDLVEGVQMGTVDVSTITSALTAGFVEEFEVFSLPFLFRDFDHMYEVMDGEIGERFEGYLAEEGFIKLGFNSGGARSVYASEPIENLDDLQDMKIRTMEDRLYVETWNELGAFATPLPWGDVYTALDTGMVDGAEGALISYRAMGFYDPAPYVTVIDYIFSWHNFMMSEITFNELPSDLQEVVLEAGERAQNWQRDYVVEEEEELLDILEEEHDVTIIYPDDIEDWRAGVENIYEERADEVGGMELIEEIQQVEQ